MPATLGEDDAAEPVLDPDPELPPLFPLLAIPVTLPVPGTVAVADIGGAVEVAGANEAVAPSVMDSVPSWKLIMVPSAA